MRFTIFNIVRLLQSCCTYIIVETQSIALKHLQEYNSGLFYLGLQAAEIVYLPPTPCPVSFTIISVPALKSICDIANIGIRASQPIIQIAKINAARVIPPSYIIGIATGIVVDRILIIEPLYKTWPLRSPLGTIDNHLGDTRLGIVGIKRHGPSVRLHQTTIFDAVICTRYVHITGGLDTSTYVPTHD